jgi:dolichol-phosphate mannosyltransferase
VDREIGTSKLKLRTIVEYAQQVIDIAIFSWGYHESAAWLEWKKVFKFGLVGLSGIVVNMGVLWYLTEFAGLFYLVSSLFAIELAILNNFVWNEFWTFKGTAQPRLSNRWHRLIAFHVVSAGGLVINIGILFFLTSVVGVYYLISNIVGILVGFGWNFFLNRRMTWTRK